LATKGGHTATTPVSDLIEELTPLDTAILGLLPESGTKLGYHWLAPQVPTLVELLNKEVPVEARVTSAAVQGRIQTMATLDLVVRRTVQPTQQGKGIQITERGQEAAKLLSE
jgi:hypothetical protein